MSGSPTARPAQLAGSLSPHDIAVSQAGEGDDLDVYSPQSAMGAAINGKARGDSVTYTAPNGKELRVTIVDAEPYRA